MWTHLMWTYNDVCGCSVCVCGEMTEQLLTDASSVICHNKEFLALDTSGPGFRVTFGTVGYLAGLCNRKGHIDCYTGPPGSILNQWRGLNIIGSDNGLSPGRRQAIIWINAAILSIRPWGTFWWHFIWNLKVFILEKRAWKCRLKNDGHFVSASMC